VEDQVATAYKKSTAREYTESIIIAVILALFIRTWVVQAFKIPTGSMENNLLVGDHLLVDKFAFAPTLSDFERKFLPIGRIKRGDVIVFKYPVEPERDFIKRVIGLPGETLEVKRKKVYINGQPLDELYVHFIRPLSPERAELGDNRDDFGPVTVPPNQYFMMGDNRDNSADSRVWSFLPAEYIKGRALMIYWSYEPDEGGVMAALTGTRWNRLLHQIH
jgi:signal peptidase I